MEEAPNRYAYFVHDWPQVTWAWDLQERNLRFLKSIDPDYYVHVARTHAPFLESPEVDAQYAAAAIRIAHAQAVETLMALLGALAQAPHGPIGWMLAYKNSDLKAVVKLLTSREGMTEHSRWQRGVSLDDLSTIVFECSGWEETKKEAIAKSFARLWRLWAAELLDENRTYEYNSLKHGTRAGLGGFTLAIGQETAPGIVAPKENMVSLGGSDFGSSFFTSTELDGKLHRYPRTQSHNWSAGALLSGLELLAMSIRNVISRLRILGGNEPSECRFENPAEASAFELPFSTESGVTWTNMDFNLTAANIQRLTKAQVLEQLRKPRRQEEDSSTTERGAN